MNLMERWQRLALWKALIEGQGNRSQAANILGVSRTTVHRQLDRWADEPSALQILDEMPGPVCPNCNKPS